MKRQPAVFWILSSFCSLFFSLWAFISLNEWWVVGINKNLANYHWGIIAGSAWYYVNPKIYSITMLTEGVLMLICLLPAIYFMISYNKTKAYYWFTLCLILLIVMLISAQITHLF
ncbi:hypothetical protein [Pedobacter nototheniae]|uniref:hypothetical protein n=1 Tax=Pedobacter nototheniae TaxID=2488994 RepID=UPI00103E46EB|nr:MULTISPECIES: hypothetical protein [Pedobacter]